MHVVIPNHQSTNFGVIPPIWTVIYIHLQGMAAEVAKRDMSRNRGYCTPKSHHWWSLFKLTQKRCNSPMFKHTHVVPGKKKHLNRWTIEWSSLRKDVVAHSVLVKSQKWVPQQTSPTWSRIDKWLPKPNKDCVALYFNAGILFWNIRLLHLFGIWGIHSGNRLISFPTSHRITNIDLLFNKCLRLNRLPGFPIRKELSLLMVNPNGFISKLGTKSPSGLQPHLPKIDMNSVQNPCVIPLFWLLKNGIPSQRFEIGTN